MSIFEPGTASGVGVSFYIGSSAERASKVQTNPIPIAQPKKYHDTYSAPEKKDYSFGTSPNALRSYTSDGRGSPNRSPKL